MFATEFTKQDTSVNHLSHTHRDDDKIYPLSLGRGCAEGYEDRKGRGGRMGNRTEKTHIEKRVVKIIDIVEKKSEPTYERIDFYSKTYSEKLGDTGMLVLQTRYQSFIKNIKDKTQTFDLSYNNLSIVSATCFTSILKGMKVLHTLDLSNNYLGFNKDYFDLRFQETNANPLVVAKFLKIAPNLCGINFLVDALQDNPTISILNLSRNYIETHGFRILLTFIKSNKTIKEINLSFNYININDIIPELIDALEQNNTLTTLNLYFNIDISLSNSSMQLLLTFLRKKRIVEHLLINSIFGTELDKLILEDPRRNLIAMMLIETSQSHLYFLSEKVSSYIDNVIKNSLTIDEGNENLLYVAIGEHSTLFDNDIRQLMITLNYTKNKNMFDLLLYMYYDNVNNGNDLFTQIFKLRYFEDIVKLLFNRTEIRLGIPVHILEQIMSYPYHGHIPQFYDSI